MAYTDSKGRRWIARRPNGWPNDNKAPDGFTINGYRRIRKDGTFRLAGIDWLSDFPAGAIVYAWVNDGWATEICAVLIDTDRWNPETMGDDPRSFIAHAHASNDRDRIVYIDTERKPQR